MSLNKFQAKVPEAKFHQNVCIRTAHVHVCYLVYLLTQIGVTLLELLPCKAKVVAHESGKLVLFQQNLGDSCWHVRIFSFLATFATS